MIFRSNFKTFTLMLALSVYAVVDMFLVDILPILQKSSVFDITAIDAVSTSAWIIVTVDIIIVTIIWLFATINTVLYKF